MSTAGEEQKGPKVIVAETDGSAPQLLELHKFMTYKNIDPRLSRQMSAAHACHDTETGGLHAQLCIRQCLHTPDDFYNFVTEIGALCLTVLIVVGYHGHTRTSIGKISIPLVAYPAHFLLSTSDT